MLTVSFKGAVYVFRCTEKNATVVEANIRFFRWLKTTIKLPACRKLRDKDLHLFHF
jgi:hypothetical protein